MSNDVIDRTSGYTDDMMVEQLRIMRDVMSKKVSIKVGRGRSSKVIEKYKYADADDLIPKIEKSIEYYENMGRNRSKITLRDYQEEIATKASHIMEESGFVYLSMEVRTGKTLTSLRLAEILGCRKVVFLTKKKAISSIEEDYEKLNPDFDLIVSNYESMHKLNVDECDLFILDEAHTLGAFPKPSLRAKQCKAFIERFHCGVVLLSGTPTPESYSQMYHQVYGIPGNPFEECKNFYRFCDEYVNVKQKKVNSMYIKDYSGGTEKIIYEMEPYTISWSQKESGFSVKTVEHVLRVEMPKQIESMIKRLKRDLIIEGKEEVILTDTGVKLMSKVHQMCSGTVKFESGKSMVLDTFKADFIKDYFKGKKIGVFYKFKEEWNALRQVFGKEYLTDSLDVFNNTDCQVIALQIQSGREGITLQKADALVYYNIDFSATSYWQSRDRMTTKERERNDVYWVFSEGGIEDDVYKAVMDKKDYTKKHFEKGLLSRL